MASNVKNMKRKVKVSTYKNSWLLECNGNDRPSAEKEINVRWCLQHGADVNVEDCSGSTPLHEATRRSEPRLVYLLVQYGAKPDVADRNGETPLHLAMRYGDGTAHMLVPVAPENIGKRTDDDTPQIPPREVRIVDMLVGQANLNLMDSFGDTPLHVAVRSGEASVIILLLQHDANVNIQNSAGDTPLHLAAHRGEVPIVKALLSRDAGVNTANNIDNTPLHLAAHRGQVSVVEMLLKSGSVVGAVNGEGDTPLHFAIRNGKTKVARQLLQNGADANVTNDTGFSPLHLAAEQGKEDIIGLLLDKRVNMNATNIDGNTPLHLAVLKGHSSAVKVLLHRGVDVNVTNSTGDTSLYLAVRHGDPSIVELLLQYDAAVNTVSSAGNIPLHVASYLGKSLVVDLLLNNGADVNKADSSGNTALHLAARRQHARVVRLLLRHHADTTIRNSDWNTPLTVARIFHYEGNEEIVSLLENAEKESDPLASQKEDRLVPFGDSYQSDNQVAVPDNKSQIDNLVSDTSKFPRKADTSGLSGQLYETKLLSLVLIRALNDEEIDNFYLGTNISNVGDMDDICLRYQVKGKNRPIMLFVQAKHREDRDKSSVTVKDVQSASGDYSLRKYFDSYLKIRERFQDASKESDASKEFKDSKEPKDIKESKEPKDLKKTKKPKDIKDPKEPKELEGSEDLQKLKEINESEGSNYSEESKHTNEPKDSKKTKNLKEYKGPKEIGEHKDPENPKDSNESKDSKEPKDPTKTKILKESKDSKQPKEQKETEVPKELRELNDSKESKNSKEPKDLKKNKNLKASKDPKEPKENKNHEEPKASKESNSPKELKKFKVSKESKEPIILKNLEESKDPEESKDSKELKDPMFEGKFSDVECNLIIYTPAKDCFTRKNTDQEVSEKVHYLINTSEKSHTENKVEVFQYKYEKSDIENLNKITVIERLKKSGADFLRKILSENTDTILVDKLITKFHVVIGREVLQLCKIQEINKDFRMWEFRPQFFESKIDYLLALKRTFVRVVSSKRSDQSKITNEDKSDCEKILEDPCAATISKLIGKLVSYNDKTKKLQLIEVAAFKKKFKTQEFKNLLEKLNEIKINDNVISEAVKLKLESKKIKLPLSFGNLDMTFRGSEARVQKRIKAVAEKIIDLLVNNGHMMELYIDDDNVGPGKKIEQGFIDINGGIGSAVGNLLVTDPDTNSLKFILDCESLPPNAALFLNAFLQELNKEEYEEKYKPVLEKLSEYRFQIDVHGFPIDSLIGDAYGERLAREYLSKLWFYTDQAKQDEVENIVKDEIDKFYNNEKDSQIKFKIHSDSIFRSAHGEIERWWKQNIEANYLTRDNDFYQKAKLDCFNNLLLTVMYHIYESKIYNVDFKFNPRTQQDDEKLETPAIMDIVLGQKFKMFEKQSKRINTDSSKKIKDLVQYAETLANYYVAASCDPHMMENVLAHPDRQGDIVINILQNNVEHEYEVNNFKYSKRGGTSEMSGQLYKTKLLCLVLIRALNNDLIEDFYLGTNIRDIDDMDDICLRFRIKDQNKPIALFLQAKHKDDGNFTVEDVLKSTGNFSLQKYLKSYLNIRNRFQDSNEDFMFLGAVDDIDWNFVVYTPAKDSFKNEKKKNEPAMNEKVHYLITTNKNTTENFQYKHNNSDIEKLTKIIVLDRLTKLGADFLEYMLFENYESELVAQYHVLMGRKVLQPCKTQEINDNYRMWEFRTDFFKENCDYLITLKETFFDKLKNTCWDKFRITDEDRDNFLLVLEQQSASTVSKLIGKLAVYNERSKKLQLVADFKKELMSNNKVKMLAEQFNELEVDEDIVIEAIQMKLEAMKFKLPISFGNLDMTLPSCDSSIEEKMSKMVEILIKLLEINENTKVIDFTEMMKREEIEQDIKDIHEFIKTAFGNLLIFDSDKQMLKFNPDVEPFQENTVLFLKELSKEKYNHVNEKIHSFHIKVNINQFPRDSFDGDEHDITQATDFLNNLWFYINQAKEDEVEFTLKDEINRYYSNIGKHCSAYYGNLPELIFQSSHEDIQKWWMQTKESPYLTRQSELFERAKETEIANLLETVINFMFISNTSSIDIKFKEGVSKYFKFVKMHQIFNQMTTTLFKLFDRNFMDAINIELPEISEPAPYSNYSSLGELVFSLEVHHGMEWVAMKLWALSTYTQYFLLAKGGPDQESRKARDGFLLQQLCNGRFGHLIEGERDPDDFYSFVTMKFT